MSAKRRPRLFWLRAALAIYFLPHSASAAVSCTATASGVAFGTYLQSSLTSVPSTGSVTLTCSKSQGSGNNTAYVISLSTGSSLTYTTRTMTSGASTLNYNLYTDLAHTLIWGDGSPGTQTIGGSLTGLSGNGSTPFIHTIYGLVPALQNVNPGAYNDSIVVTVTY